MITQTQLTVADGDIDADLLRELEGVGRDEGVAVDIETTGLSPLENRVEVLSLAVPGQIVVVPLTHTMPARACRLLENRDVQKLFHHAAFDMAFMRSRWQLLVEPVFCTKVAARIAGVDKNPTLEMLASKLLDVHLDKKEQVSNWSVRPLSKSQIDYAAADVAYLHGLRDELIRRVTDVG